MRVEQRVQTRTPPTTFLTNKRTPFRSFRIASATPFTLLLLRLRSVNVVHVKLESGLLDVESFTQFSAQNAACLVPLFTFTVKARV